MRGGVGEMVESAGKEELAENEEKSGDCRLRFLRGHQTAPWASSSSCSNWATVSQAFV